MAMLAEPRRKQKISLDPRGASWSNDDSKFGQKLMEKMGWKKGRGLGAKEDGKVEHITASMKFDSKGVGCSKSHADNWIAHQDDFNSLLANLNQDHGEGSKQPDKVTSLENNSKTSKGRLHYQKFTKGKDLSSKSETDLDCVFGKRKSQSGTNTPQPESESNSDNEERRHGIPTVTSTDNIQDYFKKKMADRMNKMKTDTFDDSANNAEDEINERPAFGLGFDSADSKEDDTERPAFGLGCDSVVDEETVVNKGGKKEKKKGKKRKIEETDEAVNIEKVEGDVIVTDEVVKCDDGEGLETVSKRKLKKMRRKAERDAKASEELANEVVRKKSKITKCNDSQEENAVVNASTEIDDDTQAVNQGMSATEDITRAKKKKSKKNKKDKVDNSPESGVAFTVGGDDAEEAEMVTEPRKKKVKKNKKQT
ncbi:PIN2/TERF1-interacting telomerase inhibitor 1-like isoform X2 [Mya arenaria]|uniref:PIN2/TERF1-interacting telomerase inhibitor 1-like isoform X2 n=1 Tax=Mya arenaria TaxID=6604 RepID=UPI0022E2E1A8|nr:PIN2/TERF1-interacting telomerase inhibitor 1-like isoform X2 [Mya arenaria]